MPEKLLQELKPYGTSDLLAKVGALQLLPENASRAISLDALAHLVATQTDQPSAPTISRNRLGALLNQHLGSGSMPGTADDPAAQMFTEEMLFSGGSYIVFPGPSTSEQDILRWLLRSAVLRNPPLGSKEFQDEVTRTAVLCLSVSDQIAQKAGLRRGESPRGYRTDQIVVPASRLLKNGIAAVTFTREELVSITHGETFFAPTIEPLCFDLGDVDWAAYSFEFGQLHHAPFVKTGDRYIVAVPSLLLTTLRHRILCIAQAHGVLKELVDSYHALIWSEVEELLDYWKSEPVPVALPEPVPSGFTEGVFSLDSDKALYVQLATDDLNGFVGGYEPSQWDVKNLVKELEGRATEVVQYLSTQNPAPDRILILTILQPIGRWVVGGFGDPPGNSLRLAMSTSDLRTMALVDTGDPLGLWKYARAHHQIRQTVQVMMADVLDEYEMYRARQHSYYFSDDRQPNLIVIAPGAGLEMRKRVAERLDPHGVPSFHMGYLVEVWSLFGSAIPIYGSPSQLGKQFTLVVEGGLPIPIWLIGPESPKEELQGITGELVETLAYWLWQFEPLVAPVFGQVAKDRSTFVIQVDFDEPPEWVKALQGPGQEQMNDEALILLVEPTAAGVKLRLHPSLVTRLGGADNRGERELVQELLLNLRGTLQDNYPEVGTLLADSMVEKSINTLAPLGQKKKLIFLPLDRRRELDPTDLPRFRSVQEADFAELLDGVGEHVRAKGWKEGTIPPEKRNDVLKEAVEYVYLKLEALVAMLNGIELLPALVTYQEANTREMFSRRFTVPTRLACFGQREELVKEMVKEIPEADEANLVGRFLIEYVAARPPSGNRRLSLEIYDQLMALCSEIVNWGMVSDSVYFGLADIDLSVLPSGRLGYDHEVVTAARRSFMSSHLGGFISEAQRTFASHWSPLAETVADAEPPPEVGELDRAFAGEFGLTLTELTSLMADVYTLGTRQKGPIKKLTREELADELGKSLGWEAEKVRRGLDLLTLCPRDDFLKPPGGNTQEVFPWRFNRGWSYLRRPLVGSGHGSDSTTTWGNRHLIHAMRYLTQLCLGGRLKAQSAALKKVIGRWREREAKAFEDSVAQVITEMTGVPAKVRLKKVGKRRIVADGKNLGDIDVLAVIPSIRVVLPIECKDLALARTPAEIQHQIEELVHGSSSGPSTIQKHLARVQWVEKNIDEVLMHCFNIQRKGKWKVKPFLVSDSELYAPHIATIPFPAWSIETLKRMTIHEIAAKS